MQEFIDELLALRPQCEEAGERLSAAHEVLRSDAPLSAFNMIFSSATVTLELASHYVVAWEAAHHVAVAEGWSPERIARSRDENGQRLIYISKTMFAWSLSAIEHASKAAMAAHPDVLNANGGKARYFADVIKLSADVGLIDPEPRPLWFATNTIRNSIVHNNGIGSTDAEWEFSPNLRFKMEKGQMAQGSIMTFPRLTSWLIAQYDVWCARFLNAAI